MANIHPTALVSKKASIADDVTIAPNAIIEDDVVIGSGCEIGPNAVIYNGARLGNRVNKAGSFCSKCTAGFEV